MSVPTRTAQTNAAYLRRFEQLRRSIERDLGRQCTTIELVTELIESKRPGLSPAAWRQYRSAACYALERLCAGEPHLVNEGEAAVALLRSSPPAARSADRLRTSQKKAKKLPINDLLAIQHHVLAGHSPQRQALADYLTAADLTGLRPCEWQRAVLRPSTVTGPAWELTVACAKRTNGRGHGDDRTLRFAKIDPQLREALERWLNVAAEAQSAGRYAKLMKALGSLMRRCCAELFPRRKHRPTLYTPRHQAAARWKAFYIAVDANPEQKEAGRAAVATLLGHANDETATHHYARPGHSERGMPGPPIPSPDPQELARVRRTFTAKLMAKAEKEKETSLSHSRRPF